MSYRPTTIETAQSLEQLTRYLFDELQRIAENFESPELDHIRLRVHNVEPSKPRVGVIYYADGTNWNPGSGEGLYVYDSSGAWQRFDSGTWG